jgi:VanZ family protein
LIHLTGKHRFTRSAAAWQNSDRTIEVIQMINPHRQASLADLAANLAGLISRALAYLAANYLLKTFGPERARSTGKGETS